ncbi:hypothetical protein BJ138DRAFT_1180727 [Hygrophoropsis aurantiaca]|uniref:Uncharacterized protein n=1 Tax=Hygrophoropsis aurantiaca TaxID=72124 RepID=A0ACB8A9D1_9AGAM|nr:hypothetical protein BJ138DRAFT_1180727 [Hygrophoropsis aurantiaca]
MTQAFVNGVACNATFEPLKPKSEVSVVFAHSIGFKAGALVWGESLVSAVYDGRALATVLGLCVSSSTEVDIEIGMDWIGLWSAVGAEGRLPRTTVMDDAASDMEIDYNGDETYVEVALVALTMVTFIEDRQPLVLAVRLFQRG